jgi:hypothetical protein
MRSFARPVSLAGLPGLSVPCGFTKIGLPVGMQLVGRVNDEDILLKTGLAYEETTDWHTKRPSLSHGDLWQPPVPEKIGDDKVNTSWVMAQAAMSGLSFIDEFLAGRILDYFVPVKAMLSKAREHLENNATGFSL